MMTRRANTAAFLKQAGLQLERANTDVQMVLFEYRPPKLETSVEAQRNHETDLLRAAQEAWTEDEKVSSTREQYRGIQFFW